MECPRCGEILPFIVCPECKGETPEKSCYCCWCGNPITVEEGETDFSQRRLCSDGNCIGVVNEEGVCNICKKPYTREPI
jgi:hypothetical protein